MKKTYIAIIVCVISLMLNGCNLAGHVEQSTKDSVSTELPKDVYYENYESKVLEVPNDGVGILSECDFWDGSGYQKENMNSRSCTWFGKTYTGKYQSTEINNRLSYETNVYRTDSGIRFELKSGTDELVYIRLMNDDFVEAESLLPEMDNLEESAIQTTMDTISKLNINADEYELVSANGPKSTSHKKDDGKICQVNYYEIQFVRRVGEYLSYDYITMRVTTKGSIMMMSRGEVNHFDNIELKVSQERLNDSIAAKMGAVYINTGYSLLEYNTISQRVAITPNLEIVIISDIETLLENETGEKKESVVGILTYVGEIN